MNEGDFQRKVLTWLRKNDVFVIKYNASGISEAGIPDVIMNLAGYFVAVELKKESGRPTELQKHKINEINKTAVACVLRPSKFELFKQVVLKFKEDNNYNEFKTNIINNIGIK